MVDDVCLDAFLPYVVQVFARKVLNDDTDVISRAEQNAAARTYASAMHGIQVRSKRLMWQAPAGFHVTQLFAEHVDSSCHTIQKPDSV